MDRTTHKPPTPFRMLAGSGVEATAGAGAGSSAGVTDTFGIFIGAAGLATSGLTSDLTCLDFCSCTVLLSFKPASFAVRFCKRKQIYKNEYEYLSTVFQLTREIRTLTAAFTSPLASWV